MPRKVMKKKSTVVKKPKKLSKDNEGLSPTMGDMLAQVVMPKHQKKAILETLVQEQDQAKKDKLFKTWGFDAVIEKGKGLVFMFYGEPGTGKTMCAQAIAEHLGRKFLILGTGDLQSSVPGQMERNIKEAFKKAKSDKLVIIFDECDSLLYNRNHVGAILGAEINCLLSEIERFEGVVILTTNRSLILDEALERRVALKLEFQHPDEEMREAIWGKLLPKECPLHKDVDIKRLSQEFPLTGGNIKNIVLAAARRAIYHDKDDVCMEDFLVAIEKELSGKKAFSKRDKIQRIVPEQTTEVGVGGGLSRRISIDKISEGATNGVK